MAVHETPTEKATAQKLHRQFGHPNPEALIQLIKKAGIKNSKLIKEVRSISENCVICLRNKRSSPRPVVCLPLAQRFNEMVGMDLKYWNESSYFLVMVDIGTRYCAAYVIKDKKTNTIIKSIFTPSILVVERLPFNYMNTLTTGKISRLHRTFTNLNQIILTLTIHRLPADSFIAA